MGAGIASIYAAIFPEKIKALIMLDLIKPLSLKAFELVGRRRNEIENRLDFETTMSSRPERVYPTLEKAMERLMQASTFIDLQGNLTEASARILLQRGAKEVIHKPGLPLSNICLIRLTAGGKSPGIGGCRCFGSTVFLLTTFLSSVGTFGVLIFSSR